LVSDSAGFPLCPAFHYVTRLRWTFQPVYCFQSRPGGRPFGSPLRYLFQRHGLPFQNLVLDLDLK